MKRLKRTIYVFATVTLFVAIAGVVYTAFGRGVTSANMSFAFAYPLVLGLLVNTLLLIVQQRMPFVGTVGYRAYSNIYNFGISALTVYSALKGVLDIFGTVSYLLTYLMLVGWAAVVAGLSVLIILLVNVRQAIQRQTRRTTQRSR
jgi:hypothetical protein